MAALITGQFAGFFRDPAGRHGDPGGARGREAMLMQVRVDGTRGHGACRKLFEPAHDTGSTS